MKVRALPFEILGDRVNQPLPADQNKALHPTPPSATEHDIKPPLQTITTRLSGPQQRATSDQTKVRNYTQQQRATKPQIDTLDTGQ